MRNGLFTCTAMLVAGLFMTTTSYAADPAVKCETSKLKESGKYSNCRLKAEAKGVQKNLPPDYAKCETKFSEKWGKTETKAGPGICPSEGDQMSMDARITTDAAEIAMLLAGGSVPAACAFPASGQTTSYGPGSDGDVQAGAALISYTDNGDGTITDNNTGLIWEKKDDSGGIHDQDNTYEWSTGTGDMDGTITTTFLDTLNDVAGSGASCFAGHCDWRIPNARELQSIVNYEVTSPVAGPVFHQSATCTGCMDVTLAACSCTVSDTYWSSTTLTVNPVGAWFVGFNYGGVNFSNKSDFRQARAVRGGL